MHGGVVSLPVRQPLGGKPAAHELALPHVHAEEATRTVLDVGACMVRVKDRME